jgi:hypothetical protein
MGSLWDDVDAQELEAMLPTPSVAAAAAAEMAVAEAATAAEEKTAVQQFLFPDKEELPNGTAHARDRVWVKWEVAAGKREGSLSERQPCSLADTTQRNAVHCLMNWL